MLEGARARESEVREGGIDIAHREKTEKGRNRKRGRRDTDLENRRLFKRERNQDEVPEREVVESETPEANRARSKDTRRKGKGE